MLRVIVCLVLCLSLPGQSAWAAWRMAASPVAATLGTTAAMPCHGDAGLMQDGASSVSQDEAAGASPTLKASSTCPHCGTCAACMLAHALPTGLAPSTADWQPRLAPAQPAAARVARFTTAGPERPPRAV